LATITKNNPLAYQNPRIDILKHLGVKERILDIGCNNGSTGKYYKDNVNQKSYVVGLDYNEDSIADAIESIDEAYVCNLDNLLSFKKLVSNFQPFDVIIFADAYSTR
jgi:SAM-dependent methyltransferase